MLGFCEKNKGAISVFLTLILLPVLLLGGLTTDVSRIYMSKVVISDAGEMAMNAGLAQYEEALHDEYGFLVMETEPESMEEDLREFFDKSLNGTGIPAAEDYDRILNLMTDTFDAYNIEGSQIYKTEAQKQQIVEYMKYRAPVCLTELVLDKLNGLQDVKQQSEAMTAQMDFGVAMEDCHDAMEEAYEALETLDYHNRAFPSNQEIQEALDTTRMEYVSRMSKCIMMLVAISNYRQRAGGDVWAMAKSFINAANRVSVDGTPENSFEAYLSALYYREGVSAAGGLHVGPEPDPKLDPEGYEAWLERKNTKASYDAGKNRISAYPGQLRFVVNQCITAGYNRLSYHKTNADAGEKHAEKVYKLLEKVKKELEKAKKEWENWSAKTSALADTTARDVMADSVESYREFFEGGTATLDAMDIDRLMKKVEADRQYYEEIADTLEKETFHEKEIAVASASGQYTAYYGKARGVMGSVQVTSEAGLSTYLQNYKAGYAHVEIPAACALTQISEDAFFQRLKEYCEEKESEESEAEKAKGDERLDASQAAGEEAEKEEGYPDFDWSTVDSAILPSVKLGVKIPADADEGLTDVGGSVRSKKQRKDAVSKFKTSIQATTSFLDGVDRLISDNLVNLYVAEYAMQMFSYYTVDKALDENNKPYTLPEEEVLSISGYFLNQRDAYKAEGEYILWGNDASQANVRSTVMMIFGIRMLLNSFFVFTNKDLIKVSKEGATAIAGASPYLVPIVQVLIELGFAGIETANDIKKIKGGHGITIIKKPENWATFKLDTDVLGDNTKGTTLNYGEFLRIFLNVSLLAGKEEEILARMADCIQINTEFDLLTGYTMLAIEAKVKVRTTFMRTISDLGSGGWTLPDNTYRVRYQSILGY